MSSVRSSVGVWLFLISATSFVALAQIGFTADPTLTWQTIETPHFRIHFHEGLEGLAQEAAVEAEAAFSLLSAEYGYAPRDKTEIVLADAVDVADSFAHPLGNRIVIYTAQAEMPDRANPRLSSWIQLAVFREYAHLIDSEGVRGITKALRHIFGRIVMPNWKPLIFRRGIPAYEQDKHLTAAQANNARDAMYLRTLWLAEDFIPWDQAASRYSRRAWMPPAMVAHHYGAWLVRYLEERFGRETVKTIAERRAADWPGVLDFSSVLRRITGLTLQELAKDFQQWIGEQFSEQLEEIRSRGITQSRRLTQLGYVSDQPRWSPDGQEIVYHHSDPVRQSGLRLLSSDGRSDHPLLAGASNPRWSPDGKRLLYLKRDYEKFSKNEKTVFMSDLYLYDQTARRETRLTRGERIYRAEFFPDGRRLLLAKYRWGDEGPMLAILDLVTHRIISLKEFPFYDYFIRSVAISPDGTQIALSIWRRGGYQDIYLMNSTGGELRPLTQDQAVDLDPTWSPDGRVLLFTSDRSGIYNLYSYRVHDAKLFLVTNVLTGAFDPNVSPDGRTIAFVSYSRHGYDLHTIEYDPDSWEPAENLSETMPPWHGFPSTSYEIHPYDARLSLSPQFWVPTLGPTHLGVFTSGEDALSKHRYAFGFGFDWKALSPFYHFRYENHQTLPTLTFELEKRLRQPGIPLTDSFQSSSLTLPLVQSLVSTMNVSIAYRRAETEVIRHRVSARWDWAHRTGLDLWQHRWNLAAGVATTARVGDPYWHNELTLELRDAIRLPLEPTHELTLRAALGQAERENAFELGGERGLFLLRGYRAGALSGAFALAGSFEYRFPLLSVERGLGLWPLFLDDLRGAFFIDVGAAGDDLGSASWRWGVGGELHFSFVLGYIFPVSVRLGLVYTLDAPGPIFYLSWGRSAF